MSLAAYEIIALLSTNLSDELVSATVSIDPSLQDLLALSTHRYTLENCVKYLCFSPGSSLYQKALGQGIDDILHQFMHDLTDTETLILEDPSLSPSFVRYRLRTHIYTLPRLATFIKDTVIAQNICGGRLLQLLYKGTQENSSDIIQIFQRLLYHVHQPFFAQLIQWIAYAELQEDIALSSQEYTYSSSVPRNRNGSSSILPSNDFFIQRSSTFTNIIQRKSILHGNSGTEKSSSLYILSSDLVDGKVSQTSSSSSSSKTNALVSASVLPSDSFVATGNEFRILANGHQQNPNTLYPSYGSSSSSSSHDIPMDRLLQRSIREFEWSRGYTIQYDNIPVPYMPISLAETILSIGKAVGLLRQYGTETVKTKPSTFTSTITTTTVPPGGEATTTTTTVTDLFHALSSSSASFTREDSLAVATILASLRTDKEFNLLYLQSILHRIRDIVYTRLWKLIVTEKSILDEITLIRSYYLLGRGDFYQAFLEHSRKVMSVIPSTSVDALNVLRSGPWETAAQQANIYASHGTTNDFRKLHLALTYRALRFETYPPQLRSRNAGGLVHDDDHRSVTGSRHEENSILSNGSTVNNLSPSPHRSNLTNNGLSLSSLMYKVWQPFSVIGSDRFIKTSRASVPLLVLGTAGTMQFSVALPNEEGNTRNGGSSASVAPSNILDKTVTLPLPEEDNVRDTYEVEKLCLARPTVSKQGISSSSSSLNTGAVWLYQPVLLYRGFNVRFAVSFPSASVTNNTLETLSFGIVLHRDHQSIVLGNPIAGAGYGNIQNSMVIQILGKRLPSSPTSSSSSSSSITHPTSDSTLYRIVAAVYGPPNTNRNGIASNTSSTATGNTSGNASNSNDRTLLASGAVMEIALSSNTLYSLKNKSTNGNTTDNASLVNTILRQLHLCIEYLPPGVLPETSSTTTTSAPTTSNKGRLRVTLWDAESYQRSITNKTANNNTNITGDNQRRLSTHSHTSKVSLPTTDPLLYTVASVTQNKSVLDVPLTIEEIINFTGIYGPGRGRGYIGLTSESTPYSFIAPKPSSISSSTTTSTVPVPVWLDSLDFVSYSEADEAYGGFHPEYIPLTPLHLILHSGAMGVYEDFFRVTLRAKAVALGLQETWRLLIDSFSPTRSTSGTGSTGKGFPKGNVSSSVPSDELPAFEYNQRRTNDTTMNNPNVSFVSDGVSAQVSGKDGKRDTDIVTRMHQRLRLHEIIRPIWLLRSQMQFVMDALLYHLQVDVVETAYTVFQEAIQDANNYSTLQYAHEIYLRSLLDGAFLTQPSVSSCIARLLNHCERFISLVTTHKNDLVTLLRIPSAATVPTERSSSSSSSVSESRTVINEITQGFATDVRYLETAGSETIKGLHGAGAASLFLRLDFNNFYNN